MKKQSFYLFRDHFGKEVQNINLGASVIHLVGGGHKEAGRALVMQAQQAFGIVN